VRVKSNMCLGLVTRTALLLLAVLACANVAEAFSCPDYCLACQRLRGRIAGYPARRTLLAAVDEDTGSSKTAPMRTICTVCEATFVPSMPYGTRCGTWSTIREGPGGGGWPGQLEKSQQC